MSSPAVDYAKLAEQARSTGQAVDYAKLADQARGSTENTRKYLAENEGKAILGPKVEHSALSLVSEFLQGLPMAARREHERITGQPISKTLKESVSKALEAAMPLTQIPGMLMAQLDEAKKAYRDAKDGDYVQAGGHALAAALPGLGPAAAGAGEQIARGDTAGGVARGAGQVALALAPAIKRGAQSAPSGVRGAYSEAMEPTALPAVRIPGMGRIQVEAQVPTIMADAAKGAAAGGTAGAILPGVTTVAGAAAGGAAGAAKTLVRGYKKGTAEFREAQRQAAMPPRAPLTAAPADIPSTTPTPQAAPPVAAPGALPSGRKPGGIQNQRSGPAPLPAETPQPSAAVAVDPLDSIAAEIGYKKPYSKLTASQQMEVKIAQKAAAQVAEKAVAVPETVEAVPQAQAPASAPKNTAFEDAYNKALARLKASGEVPQEFERGTHGGPDPEIKAFDTGSGGPTIDSSKSRFRAPVANPQLLKPEQLTQHIERLSKKPNRTPGETNLLNQLRDEVKKRGAEAPKSPNLKTKLDLMLDTIEKGKKEITFDIREGFTADQVERLIREAKQRGFDASSDGEFVLVRDLRDKAIGIGAK